jgi:lipopolysaccharide exporter
MLPRWLNIPPHLSWNALSTGLIAIGQLVLLMALARLLAAADFGLMALAQTCLALAFFLTDGGLSNAILLEKNFTRAQLGTFWQLNLAIGACCALVLWGAKGTLAWALTSPELPQLMPWACASIMATAMGSVHKSVLRSRLAFRSLALIEIAAFFTGAALTLYGAWRGWGVHALLAGNLLTAALSSAAAIASGINSCTFWGNPDWPTLRQWTSFGIWQIGDRFVTFIHSRADIVLITKFLGAESAGIFDVLKQLAARPNNLLSAAFGPVYLSLMGGGQSRQALTDIYADLVRRSTRLTIPLYAGVAAAAPFICRWVLGPSWEIHSPLLQAFAPYFLFRSTGMFSMLGPVARAQSQVPLRWNTFHAIFMLLALTLGMPYGLWGLTISLLAVQVVLFYPNYHYLIRPYLQFDFYAYCRLFWPAVWMGIGVFVVVYCFTILL